MRPADQIQRERDLEQRERDAAAAEQFGNGVKKAVLWAAIGLFVIVGLIWGWMLATPKYNLYKKNTEKQAVIAEQEAKSKAAVYEAEKAVTVAEAEKKAKVIDAEAVAEANQIINASLTPEYLQYEYIRNFADAGETVIYVPTEGLIPVTEAGRAVTESDGE